MNQIKAKELLREYLMKGESDKYYSNSFGSWKNPSSEFALYTEAGEDKMGRLLERSQKIGWRAAAQEILGDDPRLSASYLSNEIRGDFLYSAPEDCRGEIALDVGCGMGGILPELSQRYREVIGLEMSESRANFSSLRCSEDGFENVVVVNDSLNNIQFQTGAFDLVIVNGVLEWVPCSVAPNIHPTAAQLAFLKKIRSLLRPDGTMYLGIENRYSYEALRGAPDPHTGVPYNSIVPRIFANWVLRRHLQTDIKKNRFLRMDQQKVSYRNFTYSLNGYKKLLSKSGFGKITIRIPFPTYNNPKKIFSDSPECMKVYSNDLAYISKFYELTSIFPSLALHTSYSYAFFCRKTGK